MRPASLSLVLIALHGFAPLDCAARLRDAGLLLLLGQHQQGGGSSTHTPAAAGRHTHPNAPGRPGRSLLVILPKRTATKKFVSIFDVRRKRVLCVDLRAPLLRHVDRQACPELRSRRPLGAAAQRRSWPEVEPPERPAGRADRRRIPPVRRSRRSEEVNPSDPLRTESHPVKDAGQPEQDQTGAVSKETIDSCDDPLQVLRRNSPGSPIRDRAGQDQDPGLQASLEGKVKEDQRDLMHRDQRVLKAQLQ